MIPIIHYKNFIVFIVIVKFEIFMTLIIYDEIKVINYEREIESIIEILIVKQGLEDFQQLTKNKNHLFLAKYNLYHSFLNLIISYSYKI